VTFSNFGQQLVTQGARLVGIEGRRNRQCARANTIRCFELAEGKTSLTMATDLAVREPWKNRWIRFDR